VSDSITPQAAAFALQVLHQAVAEATDDLFGRLAPFAAIMTLGIRPEKDKATIWNHGFMMGYTLRGMIEREEVRL